MRGVVDIGRGGCSFSGSSRSISFAIPVSCAWQLMRPRYVAWWIAPRAHRKAFSAWPAGLYRAVLPCQFIYYLQLCSGFLCGERVPISAPLLFLFTGSLAEPNPPSVRVSRFPYLGISVPLIVRRLILKSPQRSSSSVCVPG